MAEAIQFLPLLIPFCLPILYDLFGNWFYIGYTKFQSGFTFSCIITGAFMVKQTTNVIIKTSPVSIDSTNTTPIFEECSLLCHVPSTVTPTLAISLSLSVTSMFPGFSDIIMIINPLTTNVQHHIENSQLICNANKLFGFYMMGNIDR